MNRQLISNRASSLIPQIRQMNNSYKSYGVWEGVREDPEGGSGLGGQLGGQGSKKGQGSRREVGGS